MSRRRAKIVCTIGPAVDSPQAIAALIEAGMDVARLNFSHGNADEHARRVEWIRAASEAARKPVAILQDLPGPKIRTGDDGPSELRAGELVRVVGRGRGDSHTLTVSYADLAEHVKADDRILLADGTIELRVESVSAEGLLCHVEHGGALRARMGVNLPTRRVRLRAITERDRKDLDIGLRLGVDFVALSFVHDAAEVRELRQLCEEGGRSVGIVAKIETPVAVDNIESIAVAADAVMVARGDLGVELPPERVPVVQKRLIRVCRARRRPVIVATQMLESMIDANRPTRAEASDVANAVFDGADAVMLSAETATGKFPTEACAMMARIIAEAEEGEAPEMYVAEATSTTSAAVAAAASRMAEELDARFLLVFTSSGYTARLVSQARPERPTIGLSSNEDALRRMALYWGIQPHPFARCRNVEDLVTAVLRFLRDRSLAVTGDRVVLVFGMPLNERGTTNSIRVESV